MRDGLDALKRMAQMAKNRLRNKVQENDNKTSKGRTNFKVIYTKSLDIKSKIISKEDSKLYQKVSEMLEENCDISNPIARLIDYKVYNKLEDSAKERYLFDLVNKYNLYKTKYEQEKSKQII